MTHVNFDAPAGLHKWPSFKNERRTDGSGPYLIVAATLGECVREFMARPSATRHLYEIQTAPQPPLVSAVLSGEIVAELARGYGNFSEGPGRESARRWQKRQGSKLSEDLTVKILQCGRLTPIDN
jgi:hypothetical protein